MSYNDDLHGWPHLTTQTVNNNAADPASGNWLQLYDQAGCLYQERRSSDNAQVKYWYDKMGNVLYQPIALSGDLTLIQYTYASVGTRQPAVRWDAQLHV